MVDGNEKLTSIDSQIDQSCLHSKWVGFVITFYARFERQESQASTADS